VGGRAQAACRGPGNTEWPESARALRWWAWAREAARNPRRRAWGSGPRLHERNIFPSPRSLSSILCPHMHVLLITTGHWDARSGPATWLPAKFASPPMWRLNAMYSTSFTNYDTCHSVLTFSKNMCRLCLYLFYEKFIYLLIIINININKLKCNKNYK
jgi:hypothetical protein